MAYLQTHEHLDSQPEMVKAQTCTPSIIVRDVSASYWIGHPVLNHLNLELQDLGLWWLTAPNGIGKSTLFEVLSGYLVFEGTVNVCGKKIICGKRAENIRIQRSEPAFVPGVTLRDHFHLYSVKYRINRSVLENLASQMGMNEHLDKTPETVSKGTLKKAWFIVHSAGNEAVWCLDEPFDGVDAESVSAMANHLVEESKTRLILVTSHHLPSELVKTVSWSADPFQLHKLELSSSN